MSDQQTTRQAEQNTDNSARVQALVKWHSANPPTTWAIKNDRLEACWHVTIEGDSVITEYVAGSLELSKEDAIACVSEQFAGDWLFHAAKRELYI